VSVRSRCASGAEVKAVSALAPLLKCTAGIARHTRTAVAAIKRGAHGNETNIWLRAALSPAAAAVRAVSNLPIRIYPGLHPVGVFPLTGFYGPTDRLGISAGTFTPRRIALGGVAAT